ncbi:response regulator [Pseudidiomarina donghaiensis]|uniref:response regulator n=1 Tax=Pseudidiomarina donghaiensis TaxID=519452 RepID=UPI003A97A507
MRLTTGRLLVLDDDHQVSSTIREMAQAAGFTAQSCTAADEFFKQVQQFDPTHIILDLAMPGADGVEVMRRLAQEQCHATPCRAVGN